MWYILTYTGKERASCMPEYERREQEGSERERKRERKRMKDSAEVFGRRAEVDTIVDP